MQSELRRTMLGFTRNPTISAHTLRRLYESNPGAFINEARTIIKEDIGAPGVQYVLTLLLSDGVLLKWLCDQDVFALDQASRIVGIVRKVDPRIDVRLISAAASGANSRAEDRLDESSALRILDLTSGRSGSSIHPPYLPMVAQFLRHSSPRVRSKAALIVGRGNRNAAWVKRQLGESDARLRANSVEALWGVNSDEAKAVFFLALGDSHNRVAGNALVGLYKTGDTASIPLILQMTSHAQPVFRETAIWAMRHTGDPRFVHVLANMSSDIPKLQARILRTCAALRRVAGSRADCLRVLAGDFEYDETATRATLMVTVLRTSGPVRDLTATQFVVWRDDVLVHEYQAERLAGGTTANIALVVPWAMNRAMQGVLFDAVSKALRHRRPEDAWCVVKYRNDTQDRSQDAPRVTHTLGLEVGTTVSRAEPPPDKSERALFERRIRFSTVNDRIEDMLRETGTYETSAPTLSAGLRSAIDAMPPNRHNRSILLVLDESTADLDALGAVAQERKIAVHTVALAESQCGGNLSNMTGGTQSDARRAGQLADAFERLVAARTAAYRVSFPCEAAPASVKIHVFTTDEAGETDLVIQPQNLKSIHDPT